MSRSPLNAPAAEEVVVAYHERSKHHFHRFAASPGYLDWATQPDPFRRFTGAAIARLPMPPPGRPLPYRSLYSRGALPAEPLSCASISLFLRYALSITAWKQAGGARWALRANPSSGNLHPTEAYLLLPLLDGIAGGPAVHHYAPKEHALERRAEIDADAWREVEAVLPQPGFLVGLSSIHWREAWKYGERAFRYCQHDAGHALGALRIAAAALGWRLVLIGETRHTMISALLGLDRPDDRGSAESEEPELLALVVPTSDHGAVREAERAIRPALGRLVSAMRDAVWQGRPNVLSPEHVAEWDVIEQVAHATRGAVAPPAHESFADLPDAEALVNGPPGSSRLTAEAAILGRRSAVAMDGTTSLPLDVFLRMLARLMPTNAAAAPWDAIGWRPRIHLVLFVHRVLGLRPGVYALVRDPARISTLRALMQPEFVWEKATEAPTGLPLYLLQAADSRNAAATLACRQAIAGDGAFSLSMIADYMDSLSLYGAGFYRNLFWECGLIGQVLYLEAEEAGLRATGIGCYFDDPVHDLLGLASRTWQSFYHFTVGGPVEDTRLTTLPAYVGEGISDAR